MRFKEFGIKKDILNAVRKAGYEEATPIQEQAIPVILEGRDVIGLAQTGTGKTAAFALPILNNVEFRKKPKVRALILTPTRELAIQIFENFKKYGRYMDLRTACLYGGAKKGHQIGILKRGIDIVVATPGRLMDLYNEGYIDLDSVEYFVLDEADRMLDMGFIPDVRKINALIPKNRQMMMFSATMDKEVEKLTAELLNDPVKIQVSPENNPAETVEQFLIYIKGSDKDQVLIDFLKKEIHCKKNMELSKKERKNAIVFARTKRGADRLTKALQKENMQAIAIHGDKTQGQRKDALDRFRSGQIQILVATDVAARGLDIPKLNYVFNYDLPEEPDNYIHRIGRTGRAGETGVAYTICCEDELALLLEVERLMDAEIPLLTTEWSVELNRDAYKNDGRHDRRDGKRFGRRDGKRFTGRDDKKSGRKDGKRENQRNGHRNGQQSRRSQGEDSRKNDKNNQRKFVGRRFSEWKNMK